MKVNPVAIQSYQQAVRRDDQVASQQDGQAADVGKRVKISPQNEGVESKVSVRASVGNYADILTPEEKGALDLLFSRFRDSDRFGPNYRAGDSADSESDFVGGLLDVKG